MSAYRELNHSHTEDEAQFHALLREGDGDDDPPGVASGRSEPLWLPPAVEEVGESLERGVGEPEPGPGGLPYRRLGPSSDSGDVSPGGERRAWCSSCGALGLRARGAWAALVARCAASRADFNAWLLPERSDTPQAEPTSRYVALIPLSDDRLKPRRTKLIVGMLMLFALILAVAVFFLVPRGVSVGRIEVHSEFVSWNKTMRTFQLGLEAELPIFNPNYLQTNVYGVLHIVFYDAETGVGEIAHKQIPARAHPSDIHVKIDASHIPQNYTLTIMEHCLGTLEPRTLIFFLKGHLHASYFLQTQHLQEIDTYFMIDCVLINSDGDDSPTLAALPGHS